MRRHPSARVAGVLLAAALLGGCSTPPHVLGSSAPATTPSPALRPSTTPPQPPGPDERACASVQASLAHLTSNTAHWSPTLKPFDAAVAAQIARTSRDLSREAPTAKTLAVRKAVADNAKTFLDLAAAMTHKDRALVDRTIGGTRRTYRELKKVCRY